MKIEIKKMEFNIFLDALKLVDNKLIINHEIEIGRICVEEKKFPGDEREYEPVTKEINTVFILPKNHKFCIDIEGDFAILYTEIAGVKYFIEIEATYEDDLVAWQTGMNSGFSIWRGNDEFDLTDYSV